jgi:hypothetical protein
MSFTTLNGLKVGCEDFLMESEERCFKEMIPCHGRAFAPMVIFTIPHIPWNLRPILVPKAHLPKLIELLNEKIKMGILHHILIGASQYLKRMGH